MQIVTTDRNKGGKGTMCTSALSPYDGEGDHAFVNKSDVYSHKTVSHFSSKDRT
jgi:hypothetical protein